MSDIEMDTTEFVRFMDEDYENMACSYDDNGAAHLTRCTNVAFSSTTMYRLQHVGLGPTLRHSRFSNSKARDQWLSHVFGFCSFRKVGRLCMPQTLQNIAARRRWLPEADLVMCKLGHQRRRRRACQDHSSGYHNGPSQEVFRSKLNHFNREV